MCIQRDIKVITPVPAELNWQWICQFNSAGTELNWQWIFDGKPDSIRTKAYTSTWDRVGIAWVADRPRIKKNAEVFRLMRNGVHGHYVPEKDVRTARRSVRSALQVDRSSSIKKKRVRRQKSSRRQQQREKRKASSKQQQPAEVIMIPDDDDPKTTTTTNSDIRSSPSECAVCMEEPPCMAPIGCGHLCMCKSCSLTLKACPMCRRAFDPATLLRIFQC